MTRQPETVTQIELLAPFPDDGWVDLWAWMEEFPEMNWDDYAPRDCASFVAEMRRRVASGERIWGVIAGGDLCGAIGYAPVTPRMGWFHGVCFARRAHGRGIAREAVGRVIEELRCEGVEKINAAFFDDNVRVHHLFRTLGATDEGLFRAQTLRAGAPVDMKVVGFLHEGRA